MAESSQANSTRVTEQLTHLGMREFGCLEKKFVSITKPKPLLYLLSWNLFLFKYEMGNDETLLRKMLIVNVSSI